MVRRCHGLKRMGSIGATTLNEKASFMTITTHLGILYFMLCKWFWSGNFLLSDLDHNVCIDFTFFSFSFGSQKLKDDD